MIKILIYGTGDIYARIKRVLKWEKIKLIAFLESSVRKTRFEDHPVYTPEEYLELGGQFDFIVCASIYEDEMKEKLRQLQVPDERIVSGKMELENLLKYPHIYDSTRVIALQNHEILTGIKCIVARNRFNDLRIGITWLKDLSLTAGGWAVGFDYMYVMLCVLQAKNPKDILEMGLGQSSKILLRFHEKTNCNFDIVEQNADWYEFFKQEVIIDSEVNVHIKSVNQVYNERYRDNVYCYTEFESVMENRRYDFILIDGPWGSPKISRIDILPYIPKCLNKSFCIMLDDYERIGEKNMIIELEEILKKEKISYHKKIYGEDKSFCLITSEDNLFLCSLY